MFKKIAVAYNESPQSEHALMTAIQLAHNVGAQLSTITVAGELPAYTAFAAAGDPSLPQILENDRDNYYRALGEKARIFGQLNGIEVQCHVVQGHGVQAIVSFLRSHEADLLVIGLHQRDLYLARLWSTVYELAQQAPCSVLGVH